MTRLGYRRLAILVLAIVAVASAGLLAAARLPSVAAGIAESRLRALGLAQADVTIAQVGLTRLEAGPVRLKADAGSVTIDRVALDYDLAALVRDRRVERVTVSGLKARLNAKPREEGALAAPLDPRALLPRGEADPAVAVDHIEIAEARLDTQTAIGAVAVHLDGEGRLARDGQIYGKATVKAEHRHATLQARIDADGENFAVAGTLRADGLRLPDTNGERSVWTIDGRASFDGRAPMTATGLAATSMTLTGDLAARSRDRATLSANGSLTASGDADLIAVRAETPIALAAVAPDGRRVAIDVDNSGTDAAPLLTVTLAAPTPRAHWSAALTAQADRPRLAFAGRTRGSLDFGDRGALPVIEGGHLTLGGRVAPTPGLDIADMSLEIDMNGALDRLSGGIHAVASPPQGVAALHWRQPRPLTLDGRFEATADRLALFLTGCAALPALTVRGGDTAVELDAAEFCPSGDKPLVSTRLGGMAATAVNADIVGASGRIAARRDHSEATLAAGAFPDISAALRLGPKDEGWALSASARGGALDLLALPHTARATDLDADVSAEGGDGARPTIRATLHRLTVTDTRPTPAIAPVVARGRARLDAQQRLHFAITARDEGGATAVEAEGFHDLAGGYGGATLAMEPLLFERGGLQPTALFPALRGRVTAAEGRVGLSGSVTWDRDRFLPLVTLTVKDGGLATHAAELRGIDTAVTLNAAAPLESRQGQKLSIGLLDAGVPLVDGAVRYHVGDGGAIVIEHAEWPFAGGRLVVDDQAVHLDRRRQTVTVKIEDVELAALVALLGRRDIESSGRLSGRVPVVIDSSGATLDDARLTALAGGGIIRYTPDAPAEAVARQGGGILIDALKNFHYRSLTMGLDGPLAGTVTARVALHGANPDLYGGHPFEVNLALEGNLADLIAAESRLFGREGVRELIKRGTVKD